MFDDRVDEVLKGVCVETAERYQVNSNTVTLWLLWMYSLIHKVYFYAASGGESDPKRLSVRTYGLARPTT